MPVMGLLYLYLYSYLIIDLIWTMDSWTLRDVVWYLFSYRRFGTKYQSHLKRFLGQLDP